MLELHGESRKKGGEVDHTPPIGIHARSFKWAAWLGWEIESNWTEPWLFLVYSVVKPIAGAFILVLMYAVFLILQGPDQARFDFLYVGNAFFIFVANVLMGSFLVVHADREWYETIRYVYTAPISYYTYIIGRAATKVVVSAMAVVITLAFGILFLGVRMHLDASRVPVLIPVMVLGLLCILTIGACVGGMSFLTAKHFHGFAQSLPGVFYLFCGVLFPITVLPDWGQILGKALPLTYWFEAIRRELLPAADVAIVDSGLSDINDLIIIVLLAISTVAFFLLSVGVYRFAENRARRAGKIDATTSY